MWRLELEKYLQETFSGHGSTRNPGRWNQPGMPVVYCSGTLSLAVLEILVHMSPGILNQMKYFSVSAEIPEEFVKSMEKIEVDLLAQKKIDWRMIPAPLELRSMGESWFKKKDSLILRVPSAVIPHENNYLINPHHPGFKKIKINKPVPFVFDSRLQKTVEVVS